jgi:osmoprotectant transport system permease protein
VNELTEMLPGYFGAHVVLTTLALAAAISISLPLGVLCAKWRFRALVLGLAGVLQTIPGLALLALMVLVLGSFGFWPAFAALVMYGLLPILRNTATGIANVDADVVEAAHAMGMTQGQVLYEVELPLALPVIVAGVRTSAVWIVGIGTLSTPVGQPSLGNYIFAGLQTRNFASVLFGCVLAALLAVSLDLLLGALEVAARKRNRNRAIVAGGALLLMLGLGLVAPVMAQPAITPRAAPAAATSATPGPAEERRPLRVGAKTFTEQYVLASLIEERLKRAGFSVERLDSLGSTIVFDALAHGRIDVYVDYTGTIWANHMKKAAVLPGWSVEHQVSGWLADTHGIRCLGALGFENAYALAMRRDRAQELGIRNIDELAKHAPKLAVGGDYEFFQRPEWTKLKQTYGLSFQKTQSFDPSFMYNAVKDGAVDVISAFSSDGRIAALDLVVLADPRRAFPPYDAVLLLGPSVASDERVSRALAPMIGGVTVASMREANWLVDREKDKKSPLEAAHWLDERLPRK